MKTNVTDYSTDLISCDINGNWEISIQHDSSQIRIETHDGEESTYINTNKSEIISLALKMLSVSGIDFAILRGMLFTIKSETSIMDGHKDPDALRDTWQEIFDMVDSLIKIDI